MWENETLPFSVFSSLPVPRKARPLDYGPFEDCGPGDREATCSIAYEPGAVARARRCRKASEPAIRKSGLIV
jgi:hypothetical protein